MLYRILTESAERHPDNTAVRFYGKNYSYAELCRFTDNLANSLYRLGLRKGDRIGIYLFNRPELLLCYFACFRLGVTAVPVNYRLKSDEILYILNHSTPRLLITEASLFPEVNHIRRELQTIDQCFIVDWTDGQYAQTEPFAKLLEKTSASMPPADQKADTEAVILYTSGTTGKPKGVILTHEQMMLHTAAHSQLVNLQASDITLVSLALSNNFAFSHQMLSVINAGATLEILHYFDAHEVLDRIEHSAITTLYMMPVMYHGLIKLAESTSANIPNQLRLAIVAGDTTPLNIFEQFQKIFGLEICEGMGMTETQIYALNPLAKGKKLGSIGKPVPYQSVSIQNNQGAVLPAGELGEIAVKSDIATKGYLNNPQVTAESFRNGWFLTGDLGCFDEDGFLWFRGRRKQLIIHDGSNISPQEVEEVFYHHPAVFEVGVVGTPDSVEGENIQAFVALKPGYEEITEAILLEFARHHIADYKLPEHILFVDTLPKGATGKIDRKLLKERLLKSGGILDL
jgi:long-chain acyl-CoA synthetase